SQRKANTKLADETGFRRLRASIKRCDHYGRTLSWLHAKSSASRISQSSYPRRSTFGAHGSERQWQDNADPHHRGETASTGWQLEAGTDRQARLHESGAGTAESESQCSPICAKRRLLQRNRSAQLSALLPVQRRRRASSRIRTFVWRTCPPAAGSAGGTRLHLPPARRTHQSSRYPVAGTL